MMSKKKKIIIIVTAIVLALAIAAGSVFLYWWFDEDSPIGRKKKVVIVKPYTTSDTQSTDDRDDNDYDYHDTYSEEENEEYYNAVRRELYKESENNVIKYVPEYTVTPVKWSGPNGYVIVISDGDKNSEKAAKIIQQYFEKQAGVKLSIVTDKQGEQKKEILVCNAKSNTNRYKTTLKENEYTVKLSGEKLIFEGGHYEMTVKAANWFANEKYEAGKVNSLIGITKDFTTVKDFTTINGGVYEYVWGDEFSGSSLDYTKWGFADRMTGTAMLETRTDEEVASVGQDNLKLRAIRSYRKENPVAQYATAQSISTMKTMSFMEGYLEMYARVPFCSGAWPSLWANSNGALNNNRSNPYTVEIDIFECFSSVDTIIPNIHKWRVAGTPSQYNTSHYVNGVRVPATAYTFENSDNLSNEYHLYGFRWTSTEMTMSVDGVDYMTFDLTKDFDNKDGMDGFKVPISILINNYMFAPDVALISGASNVNNLDLPYEYDIDWIRLYQIPGQGILNVAK